MGRGGSGEGENLTSGLRPEPGPASGFAPGAGFSGFPDEEATIEYAIAALKRSGAEEGDVCVIEGGRAGSEFEAAEDAFLAAARRLGVTVKVYPPNEMLSNAEMAEKLYYQTKVTDGQAIGMSLFSTDTAPAIPLHGDYVSHQEARKQLLAQVMSAQKTAKDENKVRWSMSPWPNREWAEKVYAGIPPEEAQKKLADCLARATFAGDPEGLLAHQEKLNQRAKRMNEFGVDTLEITTPPDPNSDHPLNRGTHLTVGMAKGQHFETCDIETEDGTEVGLNNPSDEVYGTPAAQRVSGHMTTTRPLVIPQSEGDDIVINGIFMRFEEGLMVEAKAFNEAEQHLVDIVFNEQRGTNRLGEIGLVDSQGVLAKETHNGKPVVFGHSNLDENTAIHAAPGSTYSGITGGEKEANQASGHHDLVIGSPESTVTAINASGERMSLIEAGSFVI